MNLRFVGDFLDFDTVGYSELLFFRLQIYRLNAIVVKIYSGYPSHPIGSNKLIVCVVGVEWTMERTWIWSKRKTFPVIRTKGTSTKTAPAQCLRRYICCGRWNAQARDLHLHTFCLLISLKSRNSYLSSAIFPVMFTHAALDFSARLRLISLPFRNCRSRRIAIVAVQYLLFLKYFIIFFVWCVPHKPCNLTLSISN